MNKNFNLNEKINFLYNKCYDNIEESLINDMNGGGNESNKFSLKNDPIIGKEILNQISRGKFKIIKDSLQHKNSEIVVKRYSDNLPINLHITNNVKGSHNDLEISNVLKNLVSRSKTKHIQLPILNIDAKGKDLINIFSKSKNIELVDKIKSYGINENFNLGLKENFFKGFYLKDFMNKNIENKDDILKKSLFQIIHTLGVINDNYPNFSHNNLDMDSIYIYQKSSKSEPSKYKFNDKKFKINSNFDIKISNFGKSKLDTLNSNDSSIRTDLDNYVDDLINYKMSNNISIDKESKKFLGTIKSKINKFNKSNSSGKNSDNKFISELLSDDYFKSYQSKIGKKIKQNGGSYESTKLNVTLDSESKKYFGKINRIKEVEPIHNVNDGKDSEDSNLSKELENISHEQTGGYDRNQVPFKKEKNTPFLSNDERETFSRRKESLPPAPPAPPLIAEQKVYDTSSKKSEKILPQMYPPAHVPVPNPYMPYPQYGQNFQYAYGFQPNQIPVQKYYNISMSSPVGNHSTINRIYEDMLPVDPTPFTMASVYERKQLLNFFRNMLLEYGDGEEFSISPGPKKSLLSYIRLLELNPYTDKKNPYHGLSFGFMLYNAAYPIRYEQDKNHLAIVKNPIGLNVRLYELSLGAYRSSKINKSVDADDFEVWREIKYYEFVRENILKTKASPNFVSLYLYTIDTTSRLDYKQISSLKHQVYPRGLMDKEEQNIQKIDQAIDLGAVITSTVNTNFQGVLGLQTKNYEVKQKGKDKLSSSEGNSLVALTEAPNNNILSWASPSYQSFGAVKQQVETGYHPVNVWRSIIFQLVYCCAVLQESDICFEKFKLENNFFIKDIYTNPEKRNHWIYKVDNHEFYIPNYGYILLFDSSYADVFDTTEETLNNINLSSGRRFKINSTTLYGNKNHNGTISVNNRHYLAFKDIIDPDSFNNDLKKKGGQSVDREIIKLLKDMHEDNTTGGTGFKIREYLKKYFPEFLHNRVGTLLTREEKENLPDFPDNKFSEGELVVYQERYGEYKWAIFIDDVQQNNSNNLYKKKIIVNHSSNPIEVFGSELYKYPSKEIVRQDVGKDGIRLDPEFTLETYNLSNILKR